ncbi:hypothetical protein [Jannaschia pohangensis]|uniref:DUF1444 family protein n=1 Tax=Jannaschia pohangensis TaxID=390807 RepID=A0A1I3MEL8_9RHOB|nr:hypothetical protein [Jannaschia pohangensis]SFI95574.1 hypothetical protein SAMN04488095_1827 [Jannaschia pohangensis]
MFGWFKKGASGDLDQDALEKALMRAALALPQVRAITRTGPLTFDVTVEGASGQETRIDAHNLWLYLSRTGASERDDLVNRYVRSVTEPASDVIDLDDLLILLRHGGYATGQPGWEVAQKLWQDGRGATPDLPSPWFLPQHGDLVIMVAENRPDSVRMVSAAEVTGLGLDDAALIALCQDNWARLNVDASVEDIGHGLHLITVPGDPWLTGSLVPMGEVDTILRQTGWATALLSYPTRDQIFAIDANDPLAVRNLAAMFTDDLAHRQSDLIWSWTPAGDFRPQFQPDGEGGFAPVGGPDA